MLFKHKWPGSLHKHFVEHILYGIISHTAGWHIDSRWALLSYSLLPIKDAICKIFFKWCSNIVSPYGRWPGGCISSIFVYIPLLPSDLLWATVNGFTNQFFIQETTSWCLFYFLYCFILGRICLQLSQHFRNPLSFHILLWLKIGFVLCCSTLLFS